MVDDLPFDYSNDADIEKQGVICFEAMIKDVKSSRRISGDLEAVLVLTFRPLDTGNSEAVRLLTERQKLEQEVKVVVTG